MDASLFEVSNNCLSYLDSPESLYSSQDGTEKMKENRFFPQTNPKDNYSSLLDVVGMGESIMIDSFPHNAVGSPYQESNISFDELSNSPESFHPATPMSTTESDMSSDSLPHSPALELLDEDTVQSIVSMIGESLSPISPTNKRPFQVFEQTPVPSKKARVQSPTISPKSETKFNFTQSQTGFREDSKAASIVARLAAKLSASNENVQETKNLLLPSKLKQKKLPNLNFCPPSKEDKIELSITCQPEKQHRARYLTEGSRGCVKDESQLDYPSLKMTGCVQPVTLQVFVGTDHQKVKPHGYYQACKVYGRTTTPCTEEDVSGTTVIEIPWEPSDDKMEIFVDCVGILKLRNADVEKRIGLARCKRKSTNVRLVFRVNIPRPNGSILTLQVASRSISCTQPLGHPEITKRSCSSCSVKGGEDLFIIGKNFINKTTEVKIQERHPNGTVIWEGDCKIDKSLFHGTHIVCSIPPYKDQDVEHDIETVMLVTSGPGKCSELHSFTYTPLPENERQTLKLSSRPSVAQSLNCSIGFDKVANNLLLNNSLNDSPSLANEEPELPISCPGVVSNNQSETKSSIESPFELALFQAAQLYVDQEQTLMSQLQINQVAEVLGIGTTH
ncbi:uncharacterized protein [Antedon mediterranea]|uniref:uncharacterized protein isoform X2 n=1 Tax=Antedon mediterranea TaxID=105859 RepID=UPI003AF9DCCC